MKEDFLHYTWRLKKFNHETLRSTADENIEIISYGTWNHDAGPDFQNACVRINDSILHGHIEIHVRSSDWLLHKHQLDPKYNSCILHLVWEEDQIIFQNKRRIPCLELKQRIHKRALKQYYQLKQQSQFIPCEKFLPELNRERIELWAERMAIERLEKKVMILQNRYNLLDGDWETLMYQNMAFYTGASKNKEALLQLAQKVPIKLIQKNYNRPKRIEALLFGQAGFLSRSFQDDYPRHLKLEYQFLKQKYKLSAMEPQHWTFFRMRPTSFPTIRIAQWADFLTNNPNPFNDFLKAETLYEARTLLAIIASKYWDNHYVFDKASNTKVKTLGAGMVDILLINAIIPVLFFYGQIRNKPNQKEKAMHWQEQLKSEENTIIKGFRQLKFKSKSAFHSQGLLQLKTYYCDRKRCLECAIGNSVLKLKK